MSIPHENNQAHAQKALDEAFDRQNSHAKSVAYIDKDASFCSDPSQYEWQYIGKREMLVPYTSNVGPSDADDTGSTPNIPKPGSLRWKKHPVWIVEGHLHRGESNVLALRRFYIDIDSWEILLGEGYDYAGAMTNCYMLTKRPISEEATWGKWYPL